MKELKLKLPIKVLNHEVSEGETTKFFTEETYEKMGRPDLGSIIYFVKEGKKVYGKVSGLRFTGEKSKHKGKIRIKITSI